MRNLDIFFADFAVVTFAFSTIYKGEKLNHACTFHVQNGEVKRSRNNISLLVSFGVEPNEGADIIPLADVSGLALFETLRNTIEEWEGQALTQRQNRELEAQREQIAREAREAIEREAAEREAQAELEAASRKAEKKAKKLAKKQAKKAKKAKKAQEAEQAAQAELVQAEEPTNVEVVKTTSKGSFKMEAIVTPEPITQEIELDEDVKREIQREETKQLLIEVLSDGEDYQTCREAWNMFAPLHGHPKVNSKEGGERRLIDKLFAAGLIASPHRPKLAKQFGIGLDKPAPTTPEPVKVEEVKATPQEVAPATPSNTQRIEVMEDTLKDMRDMFKQWMAQQPNALDKV